MSEENNAVVSESRFNMWRAIFAMAHADDIVSEEETKFMKEAIERYDFSDKQREVLELDIKSPQHVGTSFSRITDSQDKSDFFTFARLMAWCDGDFDEQEQLILTELKKVHIKTLDFDTLVKDVKLSFEDEEHEEMKKRMRDMYADLSGDPKSKGSIFGAVINKMWRSS